MDRRGAEGSPLLGRRQRSPKAGHFAGNMIEDDESFVAQRRWRRKSAIAGGVMFVLAGAGLLAIFNAIQSASAPKSSTTLQELDEGGSGSRREGSGVGDASGE